ncbi:MAG: dihydroxyacetone kinase subunit L [Oscillospiraceae bacterium]
MDKITIDDLTGLFAEVGRVMSENAEHLCEMDARMGDGDLGLTMKKGFNALPDILAAIDEPDLGKKLMKAGMKMASVVPSTMGTLMASGIMGGGKAIAGSEAIDAGVFAKYLVAFGDGVAKRGKCARGDRTVLDAIGAASDRASAVLADNPAATLAAVAEAAYLGAQEGVAATRSMAPKFGKAVVHSAKALGTDDQGATAGMLMIKGYRDYICK